MKAFKEHSKVIFNSTASDSTGAIEGYVVYIPDNEYDLNEVGYLYQIVDSDGNTHTAFEDELEAK